MKGPVTDTCCTCRLCDIGTQYDLCARSGQLEGSDVHRTARVENSVQWETALKSVAQGTVAFSFLSRSLRPKWSIAEGCRVVPHPNGLDLVISDAQQLENPPGLSPAPPCREVQQLGSPPGLSPAPPLLKLGFLRI